MLTHGSNDRPRVLDSDTTLYQCVKCFRKVPSRFVGLEQGWAVLCHLCYMGVLRSDRDDYSSEFQPRFYGDLLRSYCSSPSCQKIGAIRRLPTEIILAHLGYRGRLPTCDKVGDDCHLPAMVWRRTGDMYCSVSHAMGEEDSPYITCYDKGELVVEDGRGERIRRLPDLARKSYAKVHGGGPYCDGCGDDPEFWTPDPKTEEMGWVIERDPPYFWCHPLCWIQGDVTHEEKEEWDRENATSQNPPPSETKGIPLVS